MSTPEHVLATVDGFTNAELDERAQEVVLARGRVLHHLEDDVLRLADERAHRAPERVGGHDGARMYVEEQQAVAGDVRGQLDAAAVEALQQVEGGRHGERHRRRLVR